MFFHIQRMPRHRTTRALTRVGRWLSGSGAARYAERPEQGVAIDPGLASSRATGGQYADLRGDRGSVAGTGDTGEFVGRVAGDDLGYAGETGAERRSAAGESTAEQVVPDPAADHLDGAGGRHRRSGA